MAYEDFTTYTEFDESAKITVDSAVKVSWVALETKYYTGYLYKDKGAAYFSGDFTHKFEIQFSSMGDYAHLNYWMLSNVIGDYIAAYVADEDFYTLFSYDDTESIYLRIVEGGVVQGDDAWATPGPQASTIYFIEIVRDDDGGANNTGRLTAYIRTGSHTGVLQDTLVADCSVGEQNDFRYVYGMATTDGNNVAHGLATGYTQNLDIGEAPPAGWTGKINTITNPAKINGIAVANIAKVVGQS